MPLLTPHPILLMAGADALDFANRVLSQRIAPSPQGSPAWWLWLDNKGVTLFAGLAVVGPDSLLIMLTYGSAQAFIDRVTTYRLGMNLTIEHLPTWAAVLMPAGACADGCTHAPANLPANTPADVPADTPASLPETPDLPSELPSAILHEPLDIRAIIPGQVTQPPTSPEQPWTQGQPVAIWDRSGAWWCIGPEEWLASVSPLRGAQALEAYARWRVHHGRVGDAAFIAGFRPKELGLLATHVHLQKGCYPGQETVAKLHNVGVPRRALCVLALPEALWEDWPGDDVGTTTSTHPDKPQPLVEIARPYVQAMVALDEGQLPEEIRVGGVAATLVYRVGEGLGIPGNIHESRGY